MTLTQAGFSEDFWTRFKCEHASSRHDMVRNKKKRKKITNRVTESNRSAHLVPYYRSLHSGP